MAEFDAAVNYILKWEGGYQENENDLGGATNFGISLNFLINLSDHSKYPFLKLPINIDTIKQLTIDQAKEIYFNEFWQAAPFQQLTNQDQANYIFDMAINMGVETAIKHIQRATWSVMKDWQHLPDDGQLGKNTLAAIKQCGFLLMPALRAERAAYYRAIIAKIPTQQANFKSWMNRTYGN